MSFVACQRGEQALFGLYRGGAKADLKVPVGIVTAWRSDE
tara:strand:- start:2093 stop:2212 length:120 start_codon:yes stop_codon:yes gene_type:complete